MPIVYDRFARFYDLEYSLKEDDLPFYLDLADRFGDPVLEIGAGTGRITLELARAGHEVCGIDDSARMLAIAGRKLGGLPEAAGRVELFQADMRDFALKKKFALCIIPFRAFLHNLSQADQLATLASIGRALRPALYSLSTSSCRSIRSSAAATGTRRSPPRSWPIPARGSP